MAMRLCVQALSGAVRAERSATVRRAYAAAAAAMVKSCVGPKRAGKWVEDAVAMTTAEDADVDSRYWRSHTF